jgi:hypothetical protein
VHQTFQNTTSATTIKDNKQIKRKRKACIEPVHTGLEGSATIHEFSIEQYQMIKSELTRQACKEGKG